MTTDLSTSPQSEAQPQAAVRSVRWLDSSAAPGDNSRAGARRKGQSPLWWRGWQTEKGNGRKMSNENITPESGRLHRLVRRDVFGWFDSPDQTTPAHDPGIGTAVCALCGNHLSVAQALKTISLMPVGGERSYFYRVHKLCYDEATEDERASVEHALIDLLSGEPPTPPCPKCGSLNHCAVTEHEPCSA
jgi:hypothetical protein